MGTVATVDFNDLLQTGRKKIHNTNTYLTIDKSKTTAVNYIHASMDGEIITNKRLILPTIRTEQPNSDTTPVNEVITATVRPSYTDSETKVLDLLNAEEIELQQESTTTVAVQKPNRESVENNPYQPDVYGGTQVFTVCKLISKIKDTGGASINTTLGFETPNRKNNIRITNIPVFVEIELLHGGDEVSADLFSNSEFVLSKQVGDEIMKTLPLHSFDADMQDELIENVFNDYELYPSTVKQHVLSAVRNASIGCKKTQNTVIADAVYTFDGGVFADVYGDMVYPGDDENEVIELLSSIAESDVINSSSDGYSDSVLNGVVTVVESTGEVVRSGDVAEDVRGDYNTLFERVLFPVFESIVSDFNGDDVGVVSDRDERIVDLVLEWLMSENSVDVDIGEDVLEGVVVAAVDDDVSVEGREVVNVLLGEYDEVCNDGVKENVVGDLSSSVEGFLEDMFEDGHVEGDEEDEFDEIMTVYEDITGEELELRGGEESKVKHTDGDIPVGYAISNEQDDGEDGKDVEESEEVTGESDGESEEVTGESDGESEEVTGESDGESEEVTGESNVGKESSKDTDNESDDDSEIKSLNDF